MITTGRDRCPQARTIKVIEVVFLRGEGVQGDVVREVTAYYAEDGTLLAERDPVREERGE